MHGAGPVWIQSPSGAPGIAETPLVLPQHSLCVVFPDLETGKQDDTHGQVKGSLL